uniref:Uncharacterized protein n=1 Tax=Phthorimaea operculella granulovirus TaxID=192584 RepID=A0A481SE66_9BBAC|nr:hypothetical protein PhopGVgp007 [Phthorimaea operculella granulovirus]
MFQIGRANANEDATFIVQTPNTLQSTTHYVYKLIDYPAPPDKTKPVSGLDINKPINCAFIEIANDTTVDSDIYVMSMFRSTQLLPNILNCGIKLNVVKIVTKHTRYDDRFNAHQTQYYEFWYVLGIKRGQQLHSAQNIKKIIVQNREYPKTLCAIRGHVPAELIKALNNKVRGENYLHSLLVCAPVPELDRSDVMLVRHSNSTPL